MIIRKKIKRLIQFAIILGVMGMSANSAFAYVGPGLGAGTIGVILGILGSVFLALFAIFWYPIKRALFKNRADEDEDEPSQDQEPKDPCPANNE